MNNLRYKIEEAININNKDNIFESSIKDKDFGENLSEEDFIWIISKVEQLFDLNIVEDNGYDSFEFVRRVSQDMISKDFLSCCDKYGINCSRSRILFSVFRSL